MSTRKIKPLTDESLREAAVGYALSYSATVAKLRQVMDRKVQRYCQKTGETPETFQAWLDAAVGYCVEKGYVDDAAFAERYVELAQEQGKSRRQVQAKLAQRGVDAEVVSEQIEEADFDDLAAAEVYARKKRIGKFRRFDRDDHKDRDLAALGRRGFSYEICRQIVEGEAEDGDTF
jgi:regulatory protein